MHADHQHLFPLIQLPPRLLNLLHGYVSLEKIKANLILIMNDHNISFNSALRHWRKLRKVSQLELALNADVSQRHISWLETGRSQPSKEMVIKLSEAMDIPLRDRNHLLNSAGFAGAYSHSGLDEPSMAPINNILETILSNHEPYPAYVLDRYWNITMQNKASQTMFQVAGDPEAIRAQYHLGQRPILSVFLGRRQSEIRRLSKPFADAVVALKRDIPDLAVISPVSDSVAEDVGAAAGEDPRLNEIVFLPEAAKLDAMACSTAALACSGTVTTQLACAGVPTVVGYRLSGLSYALVTRMVTLDYISMVNIAAKEALLPEFIQGDVDGDSSFSFSFEVIKNPGIFERSFSFFVGFFLVFLENSFFDSTQFIN